MMKLDSQIEYLTFNSQLQIITSSQLRIAKEKHHNAKQFNSLAYHGSMSKFFQWILFFHKRKKEDLAQISGSVTAGTVVKMQIFRTSANPVAKTMLQGVEA